jgi:hypothetical protein
MDARRTRAAFALVTVGGVLLTFAPAVVGVRTLAQRDTDRLYAPARTLVVEALRDGRLPLWNPYQAAGMPLFAEGIHGVLHPISLLGAAVAPGSIDALLLAYLVAAALGALVLAAALGASAPAAAAAGLAFALSGYSVSMTGNMVFLAGLSTLPWLVAAARAAGAGARWGAVATALACACAFLSGDAQVAVVGMGLGLLLAAQAGGRRGAGRALAGMAAGVLLAGVQIAATLDLLPRTYRSLELEPGEKVMWALEPGRLLEWIVPGLFRGPLAVIPVGASGTPLPAPFSESVYLGVPVLAAAGLGARRGPGRLGLLLAGAGLACLWLALGHHLGARQLLDGVPVWSRFRYPEKLMAPVALCVCLLGALGVDRFGAARLTGPWRWALAGGALSAGAALVASRLAPDAAQRLAAGLLGDVGAFYAATLAAGLPHLLAGLAALLAADRLRDEPQRVLALAALVALAPAAASNYGAHLGSLEARRSPLELRLDSDSPVPRIAHPVSRIPDPRGPADCVDEDARQGALVLHPAVNLAHRVDTIEPYGAFQPRRVTTLALSFGRGWVRPFRRLGLTHVVVPAPFDAADQEVVAAAVEGGRLVQSDERLGVQVWAVPHRPWAFFPSRAVARELPQEAHQVLLELMARGDDATVVVEAPAPPPTAPGRVLEVDRRRETVRVEAESSAPALLVLQDAHWPGWRAAIDGQPAELLIADLVVRAVRWPAGRHTLELRYDPPWAGLGLALSAAGALLLAALAGAALRRTRPTA